MGTSFRVAGVADIDALVQLMRDYCAFDHLPFDAQTRRRTVEKFIRDHSWGRLWLILTDGAPVGYLILTLGFSFEYGGYDAFIDEVYIREQHRGQGIGRLALQIAEDACRELGVQALHLEVERVNTTAHALYRKVGFVEHDRHLLTKQITSNR
jgi:diamine N-acetyltransferase